MKILLIDPPFYRFINYYNRYFPLGLAYLAAVLRADGHDVLIYDADCNVKPTKMDFSQLEDSYPFYLQSLQEANNPILREMRDTIQQFNPEVIGITVWTTFAASAFKIAAICKELNKDIPVVMGGPHISIKFDEVMNICPHVDFLIRGEGEGPFTELARTWQKGGTAETRAGQLKAIKGLSFRLNGDIVHNPPGEFEKDLDALPVPARDLLLNKRSYDSEDMGLLMTSRGCPFSCSYCATSIWKRRTRYRSIENVMKEIQQVVNNFGTKHFTLKDDSFTVNRTRVMEFCDKIMKAGIKITWDCNTRVNLVDEELLKLMKKSGCISIKVGIETGSEKILKLMCKNITFNECREAARLFRKIGIHWTGYFMMGLPSETREDVYETLRFMKELDPDYASLSVYEPFPGTKLFEKGMESGLVQGDRILEDFYTISPKYYYVKNVDRRVDTMSNIEFEALEAEMKEAYHKHNKRVSKIAKRVVSRSGIYLHEPKMLWIDFKKFLSWV